MDYDKPYYITDGEREAYISKEMYDVLQKLESGIPVPHSEIDQLPEVREAHDRISKVNNALVKRVHNETGKWVSPKDVRTTMLSSNSRISPEYAVFAWPS